MSSAQVSVLNVLVVGLVLMLNRSVWAESSPSETIVWDRSPIQIALPLNQERRVDFPVEVEVYLPEVIADKVSVTATLEGSVFWHAKQAFKAERIIVTDKAGRVQWLLDVSADAKSPQRTLVIQDNRLSGSPSTVQQRGDQGDADPENYQDLGVDEVDLIQLAARQFYGPSRLSTLPPGVTGGLADGGPVDLYRAAGLEMVIQGAWQAQSAEGGLYVTAIRVSNKSHYEVRPDPRNVRGELLAIAAQHGWLAPAGQFPYDTTIWYLVTDRPLQEALP